MTHRYALAAVLLAALSIPAAAQQTTQPDTSKKATPADTSGKARTTITTSPGSIAEPMKSTDSTTGVTTSPGQAVTAPAPTTPSATMTPSPATPNAGASVTAPAAQPTPTKSAAHVSIKVDSTLANSVKISADSAYALAVAQEPGGKVSSADLEMKDGKLVYEIKLVTSSQGASEVQVDAMTGTVVKDKKYGGIKAAITHDQEAKKLDEAKRDSTQAKKP